MNYATTATWIMIVGLGLVMPASIFGDNGQGEKAPKTIVEMTNKKPATDSTSKQPKKKQVSPETDSKKKKSETGISMPVYMPPLRGAPGGRVGAGSRGIEYVTQLYVLAPDHVGLTIQKQPNIYWFISRLTTYPIELTIIENRAINPVLEKRIALPEKSGVQCIRLSDHGVYLQKNVLYKWFVALVPDPKNRSKDILTGGVIKRIEYPEALHEKLDKAGEGRAPHVYAKAGLWYDALAAISELIDASPNDKVLRKQRAFLLEQVGLPEISQYEIK
jgi:hypothetical protein